MAEERISLLTHPQATDLSPTDRSEVEPLDMEGDRVPKQDGAVLPGSIASPDAPSRSHGVADGSSHKHDSPKHRDHGHRTSTIAELPDPSAVGPPPRPPPGARQQQYEDEEEDEIEEVELADEAAAVMSIVKPVTITMVVVVAVVRILEKQNLFASNAFSTVLVYQEQSTDTTGQILLGTLENAAIFLGVILGSTLVMVLLYKYRCTKVIWGYLIFATVMLLVLFGGYITYLVLVAVNVASDYISFGIFIWNFGVVGLLTIFWHAPPRATQIYLICVSVLMAVSLTRLPEWTSWGVLGIVALYDLFAVLYKRGPLRVLVETAQERNEQIPGLIYSTMAWVGIGAAGLLGLTVPMGSGRGQGAGRGGENIKLGLGDFIFYSVLVGRAALSDTPYATSAACISAVLTGLCATLFLLAIYQRALPALPISIFLGAIVYFGARYAIAPLAVSVASVGVVL